MIDLVEHRVPPTALPARCADFLGTRRRDRSDPLGRALRSRGKPDRALGMPPGALVG
jgi:hypothetical protein